MELLLGLGFLAFIAWGAGQGFTKGFWSKMEPELAELEKLRKEKLVEEVSQRSAKILREAFRSEEEAIRFRAAVNAEVEARMAQASQGQRRTTTSSPWKSYQAQQAAQSAQEPVYDSVAGHEEDAVDEVKPQPASYNRDSDFPDSRAL